MCVPAFLATLVSLPRATAAQTPSPAASNPATLPTSRLSEPAWADHHKAILAALPAHADTQLLLIGDSTIGNLDQQIWQHYDAPRKALNLGFPGDATANVLWRLDHGEIQSLRPKLAILLVGTENTATQHQTAAQTDAGIAAVVADLEHRLPDAKILLIGILPTSLPSKEQNFDVNSYLGSHYAGGPDSRVTYLDVSSIFYSGGTLNEALFSDDKMSPPQPAMHLNPVGQRLLASAIEPTVARLLGDTPIRPLPSSPSQP